MQKIRTSLVIIVFIILAESVMFAGGNPEKRDSPSTISWWTLSTGAGENDPRSDFNNLIAAEFEELHPDITINVQPMHVEAFKTEIQKVVQSGNPPDLFHSWGGYVMFEFARQGNLRDITYFVNSTLSKRINMESLGVYSYAGSFYGAPYDMGAVVMWYNRSIFDAAGVSVPRSWEDLLSAVSSLKNAGYVPIALGAKDRWPIHFWWVYLAMRLGGASAINDAYGGSGSFADEPFIEAGRKFRELVAMNPFQDGFENDSYDRQAGLMGDGKAAMELMGQWAPSVAQNNAATGSAISNLEIFPFPEVEGGTGLRTDVMGGGNGYILGKDAPDETLEFLNYFLGESVQLRQAASQGIIPVDREAAARQRGNVAKIAEIISKAGYYQLYFDQFLPLTVGEALNDASLKLLTGEFSAEQTAAILESAWQNSK